MPWKSRQQEKRELKRWRHRFTRGLTKIRPPHEDELGIVTRRRYASKHVVDEEGRLVRCTFRTAIPLRQSLDLDTDLRCPECGRSTGIKDSIPLKAARVEVDSRREKLEVRFGMRLSMPEEDVLGRVQRHTYPTDEDPEPWVPVRKVKRLLWRYYQGWQVDLVIEDLRGKGLLRRQIHGGIKVLRLREVGF